MIRRELRTGGDHALLVRLIPPAWMNTFRLFIAFCAVLLTPASAGAQTSDIHSLSWLQGCWTYEGGGWTIDEQWMAPRGDAMVGMSRTSRRDSLRSYELVVIRSSASGLQFEAYPSGQPSAVFHAVDTGPDRVVFENPDHDFPQRIGYEAAEPDRLRGWIEGDEDAGHRKIDFPYVRATCPGA